jgi:hypothetical protein
MRAGWGNPRTVSIVASHSVIRAVFKIILFLHIVQQIDKIRVIELKPFGDGGSRHPAALGEFFGDLAAEIGIEDFADSDHPGIVCG